MELREMRAFIAVVEEGGMSAAARKLHVSQPSLTQTMNGLERRLGVRLLTRSSTGTNPTDAGMTFLAECRAVLARYDQALSTMAKHSSAGHVLRLGIPLELAADLLTRPLADLAATYPDTRVKAVHMSTTDQFAALHNGNLDVGLVREHPLGTDLDTVLVVEEPLGVLLAADRAEPVSGPGGVRLDALTGLDWIGFPRSGSPAWHDEVTAIMRSHGLDLGPTTPEGQQPIPEVKVAEVVAGKAFAFAPPNWSQPVPDTVVWCPLVGSPLVRRTWAVWRAGERRRDLGHLVASLEAL